MDTLCGSEEGRQWPPTTTILMVVEVVDLVSCCRATPWRGLQGAAGPDMSQVAPGGMGTSS